MTDYNVSLGVFSCGDVNGDGYEDLAIEGVILFGLNNPDFHFYRFYYGGPDAVLDFTDYDYEYGYLVGPGYYSDREWFTSCLGDVNGDGCDDMGFILSRDSMSRALGIMMGGTFEMVIVENVIDTSYPLNIEPVGDLNNDGIADFAVGYRNFTNEDFTKIYYGDSSLSLTEYEIICNYEQTYNFNGAITVGDMNGDGFPDFLYPITENNNSDNFGLAFWENSFENSISYPLQCSPVHSSFILGSFGFGQWIKHGDFNGDGYDDFVGGNPSYGLRDGTAAIWLGGENPNAVYDLRFVKPVYPTFTGYFGMNINVGDYNNDGFDDIALSAPYSYSGQGTPGYVSVYAGNPNLSDTTVSNDDNEVSVLPKTTLVIYPKPCF